MKRILIAVVFVIAFCFQVSAQARIHQLQACREIGNIEGAGDVTCIDPGGRNLGKAGQTFRDGDRIFILTRFRNLPVGPQRLHVFYQLRGSDGQYHHKATKEYSFNARRAGWAYWFPAQYKQTGQWKLIVAVAGQGGLQGFVNYCVNCPGE